MTEIKRSPDHGSDVQARVEKRLRNSGIGYPDYQSGPVREPDRTVEAGRAKTNVHFSGGQAHRRVPRREPMHEGQTLLTREGD